MTTTNNLKLSLKFLKVMGKPLSTNAKACVRDAIRTSMTMSKQDWLVDKAVARGSHERIMKRGKRPIFLAKAVFIKPTPPPSPTHPGRASKWRRLIQQEAQEVIVGIQSTPKFDDSVQYVGTVLALDRHYWLEYHDGVAQDGVAQAGLACQPGCFPASLGQSFYQA